MLLTLRDDNESAGGGGGFSGPSTVGRRDPAAEQENLP